MFNTVWSRDEIQKAFDKYATHRPEEGCWIWQGSRDDFDIALIHLKVRTNVTTPNSASRVHYWLLNGDFDPVMRVCHSCDNRMCINPAHLYLDTFDSRMETKVDKGRQPKGTDSHLHILTEDEAQFILDDTIHSQKALMKMFSVSQTCISAIKNRRTWKHLTKKKGP